MSMKILVVDDEKEIADLVEIYLCNEGFEVRKFYCAEGVLDCIRTEQIDLAILDVMLPDMDGFELLRRIRENYFFPIIMLTAKIQDMDKLTGLTLGADHRQGNAQMCVKRQRTESDAYRIQYPFVSL